MFQCCIKPDQICEEGAENGQQQDQPQGVRHCKVQELPCKKERAEYNTTKYDVAAPTIVTKNASKYAVMTKFREEEWRADQLALTIGFSGGRGVITGTSHSTPRTVSSRSPPDLFALTRASFISYDTFLKPMSSLRAYSCEFMMSVFSCTGEAGSDISKFGRFVDDTRRRNDVVRARYTH